MDIFKVLNTRRFDSLQRINPAQQHVQDLEQASVLKKFEICKMVPSKIGPCHVIHIRSQSCLEMYLHLHPIHFCKILSPVVTDLDLLRRYSAV